MKRLREAGLAAGVATSLVLAGCTSEAPPQPEEQVISCAPYMAETWDNPDLRTPLEKLGAGIVKCYNALTEDYRIAGNDGTIALSIPTRSARVILSASSFGGPDNHDNFVDGLLSVRAEAVDESSGPTHAITLGKIYNETSPTPIEYSNWEAPDGSLSTSVHGRGLEATDVPMAILITDSVEAQGGAKFIDCAYQQTTDAFKTLAQTGSDMSAVSLPQLPGKLTDNCQAA